MSNHLQADPRPLRDGSEQDQSPERVRNDLHHVTDILPNDRNGGNSMMKLFKNNEIKRDRYTVDDKAIIYLSKSMMGRIN